MYYNIYRFTTFTRSSPISAVLVPKAWHTPALYAVFAAGATRVSWWLLILALSITLHYILILSNSCYAISFTYLSHSLRTSYEQWDLKLAGPCLTVYSGHSSPHPTPPLAWTERKRCYTHSLLRSLYWSGPCQSVPEVGRARKTVRTHCLDHTKQIHQLSSMPTRCASH